jgi:hypothetical protein
MSGFKYGLLVLPSREGLSAPVRMKGSTEQDVLCTQASTCTPTIAQGSLACSPTVPADRSRWSALGPCPTAG